MGIFTEVGLMQHMAIDYAVNLGGDPMIDTTTGLAATIAGTISNGAQPGDTIEIVRAR